MSVESKISQLFDREYVLFTANGTTAIYLALKANEINNKKIILPVNICFVVVAAVYWSGNSPYFVDINEKAQIDYTILETLSDNEISAIIPAHMYGNTANMHQVLDIAKKKNWFVIEDACQALGATIGNRPVGNWGNCSITSFGQGKIVDFNMGGVLACDSRDFYEQAKKINKTLPVVSKSTEKNYIEFNNKYFDMIDKMLMGQDVHHQGIMLLKKYKNANILRNPEESKFISYLMDGLNKLDRNLSTRQENHELYKKYLIHPDISVLTHNERATYWRQNILVKDNRDELLHELKEAKIKSSTYFPTISGFFEKSEVGYPKSDNFSNSVINLWPGVETDEKYITKTQKVIEDYYSAS